MYPKDSDNEVQPEHRKKYGEVKKKTKPRNIYGVNLTADNAKSSNDRQQLPTHIHKSRHDMTTELDKPLRKPSTSRITMGFSNSNLFLSRHDYLSITLLIRHLAS